MVLGPDSGGEPPGSVAGRIRASEPGGSPTGPPRSDRPRRQGSTEAGVGAPTWADWSLVRSRQETAHCLISAAKKGRPQDVCLRRCRGPFSFLLENWRPGPAGAVRMGARHGAWCIGCCWALMAALFGLGVMSVGWMALVAVFIAGEKLLPWRRTATAVVTGALLVLGLAVAFAPAHVPGLGTPGAAMDGMTMSPAAPSPPGMPGMPGMPGIS